MIKFARALSFTLLISCGTAATQPAGEHSPQQDFFSVSSPSAAAYTEMEDLQKDLIQPAAKQSFSLNLFPNIVELKGFYLQKRQNSDLLSRSLTDSSAAPSTWERYFDILATSSHFDGKLVGEGELAYSALGLSAVPDDRPTMSRIGVRGNWAKTSYGLSYNSFGTGFISASGAKVDHAREENELWGAYDFQLFRFKTSLGQTREKDPSSSQLTLTRTATTSLSWSQSKWSALFSSSYSFNESLPVSPFAALTHGLSLAYHAASFLTIQPNLSFREQWDPNSASKIDRPSAGIAVIGTPDPDLQLIGRALYADGFSEDPTKRFSGMDTAASVNWKLGHLPFGDPSLSLQLEYKNDMKDRMLSPGSPANLTSMFQFKVVGF